MIGKSKVRKSNALYMPKVKVIKRELFKVKANQSHQSEINQSIRGVHQLHMGMDQCTFYTIYLQKEVCANYIVTLFYTICLQKEVCTNYTM